MASMAYSLIWKGAKVSIGVGAVYASVNQGVWSSTYQGSQALREVRTYVLPDVTNYVQKVPSASEVGSTAVDYWNYCVETTIGGLASVPDSIGQWSKDAATTAITFIKP